MDAIVEFLTDTFGDKYIYVIGVAVILLFVLIGILVTKKDQKEETN